MTQTSAVSATVPPTSSADPDRLAVAELRVADGRLPRAGRQPRPLARRPDAGVVAGERDRRDGLSLLAEAVGRDPRRWVHGLDEVGVVEVRVVGELPEQRPHPAAPAADEAALALDLGQRQRPNVQAAERRIVALAGRRDDRAHSGA